MVEKERVAWDNVISRCDLGAETLSCVRDWIEGVKVEKFFVHFERGKAYYSMKLPEVLFYVRSVVHLYVTLNMLKLNQGQCD